MDMHETCANPSFTLNAPRPWIPAYEGLSESNLSIKKICCWLRTALGPGRVKSQTSFQCMRSYVRSVNARLASRPRFCVGAWYSHRFGLLRLIKRVFTQSLPKGGQQPNRCEGSFSISTRRTCLWLPSQPQFETGLGATATNQVFRFTSPALTHRNRRECEAPGLYRCCSGYGRTTHGFR